MKMLVFNFLENNFSASPDKSAQSLKLASNGMNIPV